MYSASAFSQLSIQLFQTPATCGLNDGIVSVQISGGVEPYDLFWEPTSALSETVNNVGSGWHVVAVFDSANPPNYAIDSIFVEASNPVIISVINQQDASCFNIADGQIEVTLSGGVLPSILLWNDVPNSALVDNSLLPGFYTITATDVNGCIVTSTIEISSPPAILVEEEIIPANCFNPNGTISLIASGGVGNLTVVWEPSLSTQYIVTGPVGNYLVAISDEQVCTFVQEYTIPLLNDLNIIVSPSFSTIDFASEVAINVEIDPDVPGAIYSWSPVAGLSCVDCPNPFASPQVETTYIVTVTTIGGCEIEGEAHVDVNYPCGELFLPSVISPNGDGLNDDFRLLGFCVQRAEVYIYDRWGNLVFSTRNYQDAWDGKVNGIDVTGVFAYKAFVVRTNGDLVNLKGNVSVVR